MKVKSSYLAFTSLAGSHCSNSHASAFMMPNQVGLVPRLEGAHRSALVDQRAAPRGALFESNDPSTQERGERQSDPSGNRALLASRYSTFIEAHFAGKPLILNAVARAFAMGLCYPLFSLSSQSAASHLAKPDLSMASFKGVLPAMMIAVIDIVTVLVSYGWVENSVTRLQKILPNNERDNIEPRVPSNGSLFQQPIRLLSVAGKQGAPLLLKCFASIMPCSLATTVAENALYRQRPMLSGMARTTCNNFGLISALELASIKKPGDNRMRVMTSVAVAAATGINNGIAKQRVVSRSGSPASIHYPLISALAAFTLQSLFELIRYPTHSKSYQASAKK